MEGLPRQMTSETLNALKGWPDMQAVDFSTTLDDNVLTIVDRLPAGAVLHLTEDGAYDIGVGTDSVMPFFNFYSSDDPSVSNDGGNPATEKGVYIGTSATGEMLAFPAVIAAELVSTNYDPDEDYTPNTPLTSPKTGANAGKIIPGTMYTDMIVGICSRGITDNGYGHDAVAFWPFPIFPTP